MNKILSLFVIMILQFGCSSASEKKKEAKVEEKNVVDPVVLSRVESMGKYLRSLQRFEVTSKSTFDIVLENDQKTEFEAKIHYIVQRPDKLFADIKSDRKHRQYFYDGKKFTIYAPKEKFYGELAFTGPVGSLVKKLNDYGIEVPLSDLFVWGTEEAKFRKITSAMFLNEENQGKQVQDHFAVRQDKIDWQVWIQKGAHPLPQKVQYEINDDSARPKMSSTLKWNINLTLTGATFEFKPPREGQKIKVIPARKAKE
jgi:hypothetical protein